MSNFQIYSTSNAPEGSRIRLAEVEKAWGFVPKLHGTLAESPLALKCYDNLFNLVAAEATLSAAEQQIVYQAVNVYHGCEYCTAGHTFLSRKAGVPEDVIQAIRNGEPISDERLEQLRRFAEAVTDSRGFAGDDAVNAFLAAGFTKAQLLEVVTIIATKVISNYTNHLTHTPLEDFMADPSLRWEDPKCRSPKR